MISPFVFISLRYNCHDTPQISNSFPYDCKIYVKNRVHANCCQSVAHSIFYSVAIFYKTNSPLFISLRLYQPFYQAAMRLILLILIIADAAKQYLANVPLQRLGVMPVFHLLYRGISRLVILEFNHKCRLCDRGQQPIRYVAIPAYCVI